MSQLILVRGIPGSGKSSLAKTYDCFHLEADMFVTRDGKYQWKPETVKQSHEFIGELAERIMETGADLVISNTFTRVSEMQKYLDLAEDFCYEVTVLRCENRFKNEHGVSQEILDKMASRFEDYQGEEICKSYVDIEINV